jgi:hypothetical protein
LAIFPKPKIGLLKLEKRNRSRGRKEVGGEEDRGKEVQDPEKEAGGSMTIWCAVRRTCACGAQI